MKNPFQRATGAFHHFWASPWTRWIGVRYLHSKKSSRFLSFITVISMLGVGLGVAAIIIVMSVMDGFEGELKKRLMSSDMHILVTPKPEVEGFDQGFVPAKSLEGSEVRAIFEKDKRVIGAWPILSTEAILKRGRKVTGVEIKGIGEARLERLREQVVEKADPQVLYEREGAKSFRLKGLWVGQELAYVLGVIPGDRVLLISPIEREGPLSSVPRMKKFVIEGIYRSGLPEQELHTVYSTIEGAESFLRKKNVRTRWEITLDAFESAPEIADRLRAALPGFRVQDWRELNASLFASLQLERIAMFVILTFIVIVASFNIVTTLTLMVLEKKKEISILKAMGAQRGQVAAIFLSEGLVIGMVGVVGGAILAAVLSLLLKRYQFIRLPDVYYDRTLPVTFDPLYYVLVAICAFLIVLTACIYPSRRAARVHPLEGIRQG